MSVKVSVVVPVYNPGEYIEDCIASLLRQSLPDDAYEAIFVDDGSTDATPERLDRLAAEHPHMHVVHQEPSGWSGKPRNVGIDRARGEFVMFVDNDDWLGDEALERMYAYGVANEADVVVGKMAGKGRPVPLELFRVNRPHASVRNAPLIDSLTPHKMFRKEFLDRNAIRFKEGRRRLEDHVFVAETYLLASNVSVLSDYLCYYHVKRDDASNAGFQRFDPVGYFTNLREALDVVERHTEPGALRDKLYRRWLRNEMVERLRGGRLLALPADYRRELFDEIRAVVNERMGPGVRAGLQPTQRIVTALVATDRFTELEELARWESEIKPTGRLEGLGWEDDGSLRVDFTAEFQVDGAPLTFRTEGGEDLLDLPFGPATTAALQESGVGLAAPLHAAKVDLVVRDRVTAAEFYQPVRFTAERVPVTAERVPAGEPVAAGAASGGDGAARPDDAADSGEAGGSGVFRLVLRARSDVDPESAANRAPLTPGIWDLHLRISACGWTKAARLGSVRADGADAGRTGAVSGAPGRLVLPYWTEPYGNLSLDVDFATNRFDRDLARTTVKDVTYEDGTLTLPLRLHAAHSGEAALRLTDPLDGTSVEAPVSLAPAADGSGAVLTSVPPVARLAGRTWTAEVGLPSAQRGKPRWTALPVGLRLTANGAVTVVAAAAPPKAVTPAGASATRQAPRRPFLRRVLGRIRRALAK